MVKCEFKVGQRVTVHKPADTDESPIWTQSMDVFDGCEMIVYGITYEGSYSHFAISVQGAGSVFRDTWCKPVEAPKFIDPGEMTLSDLEEGLKFDDDKLPMELVAPELMTEVARVLKFGAEKYAERNWELGMNWSRPFGACLRHLWSWFNPLESSTDPETGFSHLAHAACCVMFLIAYEKRGIGTDNRPVALNPSEQK